MLIIQYHLTKDVTQNYDIRIPGKHFSDFNAPQDILKVFFDHCKIQSVAFSKGKPMFFAFTLERKHYTGTITQTKEEHR